MLLVRQYRVAVGELLLELPAGTLEVSDDGTTEDPAIAARRELEEETGMRAGSWRYLTRFYTTPGFTSEVMYLYLATDLAPADGERLGPDEDERLLLERIPFTAALGAVERGEIVDAKSIVGLYWVDRLRRDEATGRVTSAEPSATETIGGTVDDLRPVGDAVSVAFQMTTRDQVMANIALFHRSKVVWAIALLSLLAGAISVLNDDWFTVVWSFGAGLLFASGLIIVPFVLWAARKRPDLVHAPITFAADAVGVAYSSPTSRGHNEWKTYRRVREVGGFFFLDTGAGFNQLVPRRAFSPSELGVFYRLVDRAGLLDGKAGGSQSRPKDPDR